MSEPIDDARRGKILTRVRGLLAKAEATQYEQEAEALTAKAFALMSAYGLEEAMLAATGDKADEIGSIVIEVSGGYAVKLATLIQVIARALEAKAVYAKPYKGNDRHNIPPRSGRVTVVGHRSTLERVEFLYTLLLAQATRGMGRITGYSAGQSRSLRSGYLTGFTDEVGQRLEAAERAARADYDKSHPTGDGPGTAVVLADRRATVVRRFEEMFPKTRSRKVGIVNAEGYAAGQRDGRMADLGGKRFGNGRTRAIGG